MDSYQKIELSDYVRSGEGGTAVSYTHKTRNTLAKLYNPGFEADRAKAEFHTARAVFEMGIPTPEPYRLVTDGERYGAEYELIKGKRSFTRIISEEPERLQEISLTFAEWARRLHATPVPPGRLRSYKEVLIQFYKEKTLVPEAYKQKALAFLEDAGAGGIQAKSPGFPGNGTGCAHLPAWRPSDRQHHHRRGPDAVDRRGRIQPRDPGMGYQHHVDHGGQDG